MKKYLAISVIVIILISVSLLACGCEPYKRYPSLGVEPKMDTYYSYIQLSENKRVILRSYDEYLSFGANLNYNEDFFDTHCLLVVVQIGCSSNGYLFADVLVKDNVIYPVIAENKLKPNQAVTDDIIVNVFYAELDADKNYELGETIFADIKTAKIADRSLIAANLHFANLMRTPRSITVYFSEPNAKPFVIDDVEQMTEISEMLLARTYRYEKSSSPAPDDNIYLKFDYEDGAGIYMSTRQLLNHGSAPNGYGFYPNSRDGLDALLRQIGESKNAFTD